MRASATSVLKWFSVLYVVLIVIQVYLAGEGIFGLNVIKHSDDCDKKGANLIAEHCVGNSKTLDAHRALGFFLTLPGALLFLLLVDLTRLLRLLAVLGLVLRRRRGCAAEYARRAVALGHQP